MEDGPARCLALGTDSPHHLPVLLRSARVGRLELLVSGAAVAFKLLPLALRCVKGMRAAAPDAGADAYGSAGAVRARRHRARPRRRVRVGALRSREPE